MKDGQTYLFADGNSGNTQQEEKTATVRVAAGIIEFGTPAKRG
jgi:hypothetical protein